MNPSDRLQLPFVEADLVRFRELLAKSVLVDDEFLDSVATHLIDAGGKYLRPLLAICSATGGTRAATEEDLLGAVALELTHLASLYHDDVLDEAEDRRHVDTVNARYGNLIAITAGDYLMARAAGIAADLGAEFARLLAHTLMRLTRAQISEVSAVFSVDRTPDELLRDDRRQDGLTHVLELSYGGDDGGIQPRAHRRVERVRQDLWHAVPTSRRHPGPHRR